MKNLLFVLLGFYVLASCTKKQDNDVAGGKDTVEQTAPVALTLKWETEASLTTCESVLYDSSNDVLYVSNINGAPDGKDGNGTIAKVGLDGKVIQGDWVKGLDAPKGMGLFGGKLYVTDIDRIHEIDIASGKIRKSYKVENAKFLNDITVDASGKVYVSDSGAGNIILLDNGKLAPWLENLNGPNGLLAQDSVILAGLFAGSALNSINISTKEVSLKTDSIENADGVEAIGNGDYLVSSWNGMIHYIDADSKRFTLLDVRADSVNCADIEYIKEKKLLLVPTFFNNTVRAYEVTK